MRPSLYQIQSEEELRSLFRLRERDEVVLTPTMRFPLELKPYLAWREPGGHRVYLVFKLPRWKAPLGIVFVHNSGSFVSPPNVCEWCRHHGSSDEVGLMTAMISSRRWGGITLCMDLSCIEKLEVISVESGRDFQGLVDQLLRQMEKFTRDGLEIRHEGPFQG